ncbi:MAG: response regulator transcription factor [Bacteroidota bacterium]
MEVAKKFLPDIVLMDINMASFSGIEATPKMLKISPASRIIGVSMYLRPEYAKKMLQVEANGYLTKNPTQEEMIKAILEVNKRA